jgi:integrase
LAISHLWNSDLGRLWNRAVLPKSYPLQEFFLLHLQNVFYPFLYPGPLMKRFHALLAQTGLPPIRLHDLRHSAATILLSMGVDPKQV